MYYMIILSCSIIDAINPMKFEELMARLRFAHRYQTQSGTWTEWLIPDTARHHGKMAFRGKRGGWIATVNKWHKYPRSGMVTWWPIWWLRIRSASLRGKTHSLRMFKSYEQMESDEQASRMQNMAHTWTYQLPLWLQHSLIHILYLQTFRYVTFPDEIDHILIRILHITWRFKYHNYDMTYTVKLLSFQLLRGKANHCPENFISYFGVT